MDTKVTNFKHCDLVKVRGRVDSSTAPQFAKVLQNITDQGHFKLVLEFGELEFISSAGLRVLINTQKSCKRYNRGEVVLANVPANIFAALELTGFTALFQLYDDVTGAVGSF
jgi:anti-sigma B factor antagonist